jgi:hypothetical protein
MSIYFIADDFNGPVKIGITANIDRRIGQLQTGNPRSLKLMGFIKTESRKGDREIENALHKKYRDNNISGEWFLLYPDEVLDEIRKFPNRGFLAKSENCLKFLGCDRDGIAEIGGVWDWADLDWEDCCPYCGCICGLIYEEKVMLHECLNCGYHFFEDDIARDIPDE